MKIGLIGAGRMGFTLGKHLTLYVAHTEQVCVMGYYSRHVSSAREAAEFTGTEYYEDLKQLLLACDTIFLTVPDGQISLVAEAIAESGVRMDGKTLIHTSGALSSQVFSGVGDCANRYSIHPIYAVNSKTESYRHFSDCYMTIEGEGAETVTQELMRLFTDLGHTIRRISADQKAKYHASAVFASNLVIGLYRMGTGLLSDCGFSQKEAEAALMPLFANNAANMQQYGCAHALTGPVSRGDAETVEKHLRALDGDVRDVYRLLSKQLCREDQTGILEILEAAKVDR